MKEVIKLEIESVREKIKFYRNVLLALLIGLVSSFYNLIKDYSENISLYSMIYVGVIISFIILFRLKLLEAEENEYIEKYKRIENDNL